MSTLTDRYVWAVVRNLPDDRRPDIERELRSTIADTIDDRPDGDERAALLALGDPDRLAAGYVDDRRGLVPPELFPQYLRVLRLVLAIAVPVLVALSVLGQLGDDGRDAFDVVAAAVGAAFTGGVQVCFWVTLSFFLIGRAGATAGDDWTLDDLPEPPVSRPVGIGETVFEIVLSIAFVTALVWQHRRPFVEDSAGEGVPVLRTDLWGGWMWVIIGIVVGSIVLSLVVHAAGRWTVTTAAINIASNAALLAIIGGLALSDGLIDPRFLEVVSERADLDRDLRPSGVLTAAIVAAILIWDSVETWLRATRSPRSAQEAQD